jgi:GNAT superfamily N-acetyltransferase
MLGAHDRLTDLTIQIDALFVDKPHLRKFFYSGEDYTSLQGDSLHQVLAMAELLCDFMENALQHESFDSKKVAGEWRDYCAALMRDSSAIRAYLHEYEHWYSVEIGDMLRKVESSFHHSALIASGKLEVKHLNDASAPATLRPQLERIYNSSFPPEEREDPQQIFESSQDRDVLVALAPHDQAALGFASVLRIDSEIALLEYLAVSPNERNTGIGGFLLEAVFANLASTGYRTVFMELEKPDSISASHQAGRRLRFYMRHGCKPVEWVPEYWIPNFRIPDQRISMLLYSKPLGDHAVSHPDPKGFLALYKRAYPSAGTQDTPAVALEGTSRGAVGPTVITSDVRGLRPWE